MIGQDEHVRPAKRQAGGGGAWRRRRSRARARLRAEVGTQPQPTRPKSASEDARESPRTGGRVDRPPEGAQSRYLAGNFDTFSNALVVFKIARFPTCRRCPFARVVGSAAARARDPPLSVAFGRRNSSRSRRTGGRARWLRANERWTSPGRARRWSRPPGPGPPRASPGGGGDAPGVPALPHALPRAATSWSTPRSPRRSFRPRRRSGTRRFVTGPRSRTPSASACASFASARRRGRTPSSRGAVSAREHARGAAETRVAGRRRRSRRDARRGGGGGRERVHERGAANRPQALLRGHLRVQPEHRVPDEPPVGLPRAVPREPRGGFPPPLLRARRGIARRCHDPAPRRRAATRACASPPSS